MVKDLNNVYRLDKVELDALDEGVRAVGGYLKQIGKTDLCEMSEEEALMLVKHAWLGCAAGVRQALNMDKELPF